MRLNTTSTWSLLALPFLFSSTFAKKDEPSIKSSEFKFIPRDVSYFEDSDVILFAHAKARDMYRSTDAGESWKKVEGGENGPKGGELHEMIFHPFDKKRAYYLTGKNNHWFTEDRGETWKPFNTEYLPSVFREALTFHAGDPDRILFNGMECGFFCDEVTLYTTNHFKDSSLLRTGTNGCHWAKSTPEFTSKDAAKDKDRILCIVRGKFTGLRHDYRFMVSDDYFKKDGRNIQEFEPELASGRTVPGIVNMATVKGYLLVAASAEGTDEMALYVSDDAVKWHRAVFPHDHKLTESAYTILESTNYSIQVDVMNSRNRRNPFGVLLSSNSNGTYFTRNIEHTNRERSGLVDFEKVTGIQGIVLVNTVENWEELDKDPQAQKKIKSKISFDDGREFQSLKVKGDDLQLHSVTDLSNTGRVFSSPAPGLVMGIGNTGDYLKKYEDGNLYVSDDAGVTWSKALEGPHKYEFGDSGSILVAIKDEWTDEIRYSLNHGKDWKKVDLPEKLRPLQLTTTQDSTSLKFLLEATGNKDLSDDSKGLIIVIDFDELHESKCGEKDFEKWYARVGSKGEPACLMGHKQYYNRRKADADCFVKKVFEDPVVQPENCECSDIDFECDFNFERSADRKECKLAENARLPIPDGECKKDSDKFKGSSGWRKIPGNTCTGGIEKDKPIDRDCSEGKPTPGNGPPADGKIQSHKSNVAGEFFSQVQYLERTAISSGDDETVIMRTDKGVFRSENHGKSWGNILAEKPIVRIVQHEYNKDTVFFITPTTKVYVSTDRGKTISEFEVPNPPAPNEGNTRYIKTMNFHPVHKDWIIWIGGRDCPGAGCHSVASITRDRGEGPWLTLQRYVRKCEFIKEPPKTFLELPTNSDDQKSKDQEKKYRDRLIYCEAKAKETYDSKDNPWQLVSSGNFFEDVEKPFEDIVDFATMAEFIVVATKDKDSSNLKMDTSVNGQTFADARFPHDFTVKHEQAFTVLDSSTHSVFVHVTVSNAVNREYGTIIKSNSNGTSYVKAMDYVARDREGYVDFEKSFGIEGVAMVNVVANYDDKNFNKDGKKLKTMMTHNDGAQWNYLVPPAKDAEGKDWDCKSSDLSKCALHIHGYTERRDKSLTYTSQAAIGLMLANGNVGQYLTAENEDTFISSDGGVSWKSAKKGKYMWKFGDQGSIVVLVRDFPKNTKREPVKSVFYTVDEGDTWKEYEFDSEGMIVQEITTVPSDNSRKFLLWGQKNGKLVTVNLDFTGLTDKLCKLDETNVEANDYYLWTPKHPNQEDDCLFGHISQYHRKKIASNCYNGKLVEHLHDIKENCTCTRRDFECDFNYQRQSDGSCALVPGFQPPDHSLICKSDPEKVEYYEPTGYRRIPLTTCEGGKEMDKLQAKPCAGKEDEFNQKHGPSGVAIFFAVIIPFIVAGGVGYWIWKNWTNKFGQIRLGEQSSFDAEAPYIKYPILIVAGLVAVLQAIPLLTSSLWRSASNAFGRGSNRRFTTRDSFARGRSDYAVVDEDEGELLGDDSDEDV